MEIPLSCKGQLVGLCVGIGTSSEDSTKTRVTFGTSEGNNLSFDVPEKDGEKFRIDAPYLLTISAFTNRFLDIQVQVRSAAPLSGQDFFDRYSQPAAIEFLANVEKMGFVNQTGEFVPMINVKSCTIHKKTVVSEELYNAIPSSPCVLRGYLVARDRNLQFGDRVSKSQGWQVSIYDVVIIQSVKEASKPARKAE